MQVTLESIRPCLEGVIPSALASCSADGTPNVTFLSIVQYVDNKHVALSNQYFNKSRRNISENPYAQMLVVNPMNINQYRLDLKFKNTATEGPVFNRMRNKLEGVATMSGMASVSHLQGADIYQVLDCVPVNADQGSDFIEPLTSNTTHLNALAIFGDLIADCKSLGTLLTSSLEALASLFGFEHSMILVPDETKANLFALGSHGYLQSGVGAEVQFGQGIIGVAAQRQRPIRITNLKRERYFFNAIRTTMEGMGKDDQMDKEIPLPGIVDAQSLLALPMVAQGNLVGVLCLESPQIGRFMAAEESIGKSVANHLAGSIALFGMETVMESEGVSNDQTEVFPLKGRSTKVKYYNADDSIFFDNDYVIKGLPGRILFKILCEYVEDNRYEFTNKEIRLDSNLQLPPIKDNLETRLILLQRRLEDRCDFIRIVKTGRGLFRLEINRNLTLEVIPEEP